MAKPLSILFVTSEIYPYAKESGVGDVSYSYPLAMREFGHDIRIMTPKYGIVSERKNKIHEINRLKDMPIPLGDQTFPATVKSSSLANPRNKVQVYITTNKEFFDSHKGIYHDVATWQLYPDNFERFLYFSRSVIETCMLLGWYPDIIHCNDWQTAILPAYLRMLQPVKFKKTRSVLTIHNLNNQPVIPLSEFAKTGLSKDVLPFFKYKNAVNLIKGGSHFANFVTTVSPQYAKLLLTDKNYTNGLNSFFKENSSKFQGILNGIDNYVWNPAYDDHLQYKFEGKLPEFKEKNKKELCREAGLPYKPEVPIISMIAKINRTKGVDLLIEAADELLSKDVQVIFLGLGDSDLKENLESIQEKYPEKFKCFFEMNESKAHLMEAGSDMFLLASSNEPCGLNLMYSLAYGTIPIVHFSGGFKDVAKDYTTISKHGNSFIFKEKSVKSLMSALNDALELFVDKEEWQKLMHANMSLDFTWGTSSARYDEIYRNIMREQTS